MKKHRLMIVALWGTFYLLIFAVSAYTQGRERVTGTILSYGSGFNTRVRTASFDLRIDRTISDAQATEYLNVLQRGGQDDLLNAIKRDTAGRFSVGPRVGQDVNLVYETVTDGKRHIYVLFERWMQFGELRSGHRSLDYPFGFIEILIDPKTGRGEGTYIAAARVRWREATGTRAARVEVEDFATFPARLMNVRTTGYRP